MAEPDTEKTARPPHTPRTHSPPHTQMETERQILLSWAELLLPPSPPALTVSLTLSGRKSNRMLQSSSPRLPRYSGLLGLPRPHVPPSVLSMPPRMLSAVRSRLSGYLWRGLRIPHCARFGHLSPFKAMPSLLYIHNTWLLTPQPSVPRGQFSPELLPLPHHPPPHPLRSRPPPTPLALLSSEKAP